jgi:pyruvate/2-oxoglutarate dehydrogenase complex dihydrolipoamide dehydrogenase (E3) component
MIASAKLANTIRHSMTLGIQSGDCRVHLDKIIERKNKIVISFRETAEKGVQNTPNLHLIMGEAVFTGIKTIDVRSKDGTLEKYTADKIFINTGTSPRIPPIKALKPFLITLQPAYSM